MARKDQIIKASYDACRDCATMSVDEVFIHGAEWADSHPNWHKYPYEKPEKKGNYLTAYFDGTIEIVLYSAACYKFWHNDSDIIAWMELPAPPKFD